MLRVAPGLTRESEGNEWYYPPPQPSPARGEGARSSTRCPHLRLVLVVFGLEGAVLGEAQVRGLLVGELGQVDGQVLELQPGDLLVQLLGEDVHANRVLTLVAEKL